MFVFCVVLYVRHILTQKLHHCGAQNGNLAERSSVHEFDLFNTTLLLIEILNSRANI